MIGKLSMVDKKTFVVSTFVEHENGFLGLSQVGRYLLLLCSADA